MSTDRVTLLGAPGSPYTRKMLAVLRYRRIPYRFLMQGSEEVGKLPQPKVHLLPTFFLPDDNGEIQAITDSTPLIRRFEEEVDGRSIIPPDPALAFLDFLLEDYGDEWLTKAMFHYRWAFGADVEKAGNILPLWSRINVTDEAIAPFRKMITERQIERLRVVGSNDVTGPVIEASYRRFLELFDAHLQQSPWLMGERPGASDFAFFGQLTQLATFDPTPEALTLEVAPRVYAWVQRTEDLSGMEPKPGDWLDVDAVPSSLRGLLAEMGRVYVPCMLANAAAVADGASAVEATVDGARWTQQPFPYQAKCVRWLREAHQGLEESARKRVDAVLQGTGCEALFSG